MPIRSSPEMALFPAERSLSPTPCAPQRTPATWLANSKNGSGYRNSARHDERVRREGRHLVEDEQGDEVVRERDPHGGRDGHREAGVEAGLVPLVVRPHVADGVERGHRPQEPRHHREQQPQRLDGELERDPRHQRGEDDRQPRPLRDLGIEIEPGDASERALACPSAISGSVPDQIPRTASRRSPEATAEETRSSIPRILRPSARYEIPRCRCRRNCRETVSGSRGRPSRYSRSFRSAM